MRRGRALIGMALVGCGVLAVSGSSAVGQMDLLRGPRVPGGGPRVEVGEGRFGGELSLGTTRPEVAALDALGLSAAARARAERVLAERAAVVDRAVVEHVEDLTLVEGALATRDLATLWRVYSSFHAALEPLRARGPLADELAAALPEDARVAYVRVLGEYEAALVARERSTAEASGQRFSLIGLQIKRHFHALQVEIEASAQRTIERGAGIFELFAVQAGLSDEGREIVRRGMMGLMGPDGGAPSELQLGIALQEVMVELGDEDRAKLVAAIREQNGR